MAWEHKDGSGSLFRNDKKGNEKAPDMRGEAMIGGTVYEIAGWTKQTKAGDKFLSLAVKPKQERQKEGVKEMDDDPIPF